MKLSQIGEREIIRRLTSESGVGELEDCAVLNFGDEQLLLSTDSVSYENNIPRGADPEMVGKFLASINLSDIAAMGGIPIGMLISLFLPPDTEFEFLEKVYRGINMRLREFNCKILGGDTKESSTFSIAGTIVGKSGSGGAVRQGGIASGQVIGVTGSLGRAAAGKIFYENGYRKSHGIRLMLDFMPRIREALALARNGAKFMTDLSDGLYSSLWKIKDSTGFGARIVAEDIPIHTSMEKAGEISSIDIIETACNYGGDYEIMFTIENREYGDFRKNMAEEKIPVFFIGEVYGGDIIAYRDNEWKKVTGRGYEHFR